MDVQSQDSVNRAIQQIVAESDRLYVVIHNAGHMSFGPSEAFTVQQLAETIRCQRPQYAAGKSRSASRFAQAGEKVVVWVGSSSIRGGTPP